MGQVAYKTHIGENGTVSEGVQQPYEISVVIAIEETQGIRLSVSAYPNPINDYLTLSINNFDASKVSFQLFDMKGKLLQSVRITGNQTNISMRNFVPATYFIKVIQSQEEIKTFKIVKN
ncbi:T9SS type A sorting domain-containing protein [Candidatus Falkowbacteria bacterium]|nr:T9SS type A sorting domain-containing protein [Candidatus Falkowbacteria bacterium]